MGEQGTEEQTGNRRANRQKEMTRFKEKEGEKGCVSRASLGHTPLASKESWNQVRLQ